jgi:WD40 repeat protein
VKPLWSLSICAVLSLIGCAPPAEFSPDGKRVALASPKGGVDIVDLASGRKKHHNVGVKPLMFIAWSPDGKKLAVSDYDGISGLNNQRRMASRSYMLDTVTGRASSISAQVKWPFAWLPGHLIGGVEVGEDKDALVWIDPAKTTEIKRQALDSNITWICPIGNTSEAIVRTSESAYLVRKLKADVLKGGGSLTSCTSSGASATCVITTNPQTDPTYGIVIVGSGGTMKPVKLPPHLVKPARTRTRERILVSASGAGEFIVVLDVVDKSPKPVLPQFRGVVTRTEGKRREKSKGLPDVKLELNYRLLDKNGKEIRSLYEGQWINEDVLVADFRWSGTRLVNSVLDTVRERVQVRVYDFKTKKSTLLMDHKTRSQNP